VPRQRLEPKTAAKQPAGAKRPIVIVGIGHMGGAIARGLIVAGLGPRLILIDPAVKPADARAFRAAGAKLDHDPAVIANENPEALILAVKPQLMPSVAPTYAIAAKKAVVISIAAGTPIESLNLWLDKPRALVRAMPNLPASIGKGISAAFATPTTTASQRKLAHTLLCAVGDLVWLDGEEMQRCHRCLRPALPTSSCSSKVHSRGGRQGLKPEIETPAQDDRRRRSPRRHPGRSRRPAQIRHKPRRNHRSRAQGAVGRRAIRSLADRSRRRRHGTRLRTLQNPIARVG
jgi:hypothetical protein